MLTQEQIDAFLASPVDRGRPPACENPECMKPGKEGRVGTKRVLLENRGTAGTRMTVFDDSGQSLYSGRIAPGLAMVCLGCRTIWYFVPDGSMKRQGGPGVLRSFGI